MSRLTRCDNCGQEKEYTATWLDIRIPYNNQTRVFDICSTKCGAEFLAKLSEANQKGE